MSLANLPGSDPPIGQTPCGRPCSRLALLYCQVAALPHPQEDEEEVEDETEEKEENDVGELNLDSENFNDVGKLNLCTFVETIY